jgi:recombination associated protein RdgC
MDPSLDFDADTGESYLYAPHETPAVQVTSSAPVSRTGNLDGSTAEDLLSTLREVLGSLPVRPVTVKIAPSATMTHWLKCQKAAPDFYVLSDCQLADPDESGGRVVFKAQDLTSDELQMHLATGKLATSMKLAWQDKLSFVLDDKLGIK